MCNDDDSINWRKEKTDRKRNHLDVCVICASTVLLIVGIKDRIKSKTKQREINEEKKTRIQQSNQTGPSACTQTQITKAKIRTHALAHIQTKETDIHAPSIVYRQTRKSQKKAVHSDNLISLSVCQRPKNVQLIVYESQKIWIEYIRKGDTRKNPKFSVTMKENNNMRPNTTTKNVITMIIIIMRLR